MTKERRFGNHVVNESMLRKSTYQKGVEEELAKQIALYVREDPLCFKKDRGARDKLLAKFELDVTVLKNYPEALKAMYETLGEQIPATFIGESAKIREETLKASSDTRKQLKMMSPNYV